MTCVAPTDFDNAATLVRAPALVRVDARWGHFGLGPDGELRAGADAIVVTSRRGRRTGYGAAATTEVELADGLEWIWRMSADLVRITDVRALWAFSRRRRATIAKLPGAWAAIELSLLDLFAQEKGHGIGGLLGEEPSDEPLPRMAMLTDEVGRDLEDAVLAADAAGIADFSVRLCGNVHRDRARFAAIRTHVPEARIRVQCEGMFETVKDAYGYLWRFAGAIWALDGVFAPQRTKELAQLCEALECSVVITDPSHVCLMAAKRIPWVAELDLARAGGLLRALELAHAARSQRRPRVLGAPTSTHPREAEAYRILNSI